MIVNLLYSFYSVGSFRLTYQNGTNGGGGIATYIGCMYNKHISSPNKLQDEKI